MIYSMDQLPRFEKNFGRPSVYKNMLLLMASEWFLQPKTLKLINEALPITETFEKEKGLENPEPTKLKKFIKEPLKDIYTLPMFSQEFCEMFMDEVRNMEKQFLFEPNSAELKQHQINEFVLQENASDLYVSLMKLVISKINVVFQTIWNREVVAGGIQVANYNPKEITQSAWHHDSSADISMVIPLNTGEYEGGGTEFFKRGIINPLPNGHALIFPSFTHLHRGLPVTEGDRYLLVFWLQSQERKDDAK